MVGPRLWRRRLHLKRYRQIIRVLSKNGFGLLFEQLGVFGYLRMRKKPAIQKARAAENARLSIGQRLCRSFEELGPTFVKIGQILSMRPDLISAEVAGELEKLQDAVLPFSYLEVCQVVREALGDEPDQVFSSFSKEPLAAASLSQVHQASQADGRQLAVKVQRPGAKDQIRIDLEILADLIRFMKNRTQVSTLYDLDGMLAELEDSLARELDFLAEAENAVRMQKNLASHAQAGVPEVFWQYTTRHVLTMGYIAGIRLTDQAGLVAAGLSGRELGLRLSHLLLDQVLIDGFFHADPHPGNILVQPDGRIILLDLGMTGRLARSEQKKLARLFAGLVNQDSHQVVRAIAAMSTIRNRAGLARFEQEVERLLDYYLALPFNRLDLGELLGKVFRLAFTYQITIPGELTLLAKMLLTLQGLLDRLDPELNLLEIMQPMAKKYLRHFLSSSNISAEIKRNASSYAELFSRSPDFLLGLLDKMESDDYSLQLEIKRLDKLPRQINRITNRLTFSIILLALSIIITGVMIGTSIGAAGNPDLVRINAIVLPVGLSLAGLTLAGLLLSILRSRRQ